MLKYNKKDNTLRCYRVEPFDFEFDFYADRRESYEYYKNVTLADDIAYLVEKIKERTNRDDVTCTFRIGNLQNSKYRVELRKQSNMYYPVYVKFKCGDHITEEQQLIRIPYMDEMCKLNVEGKMKVLLMEQCPSNDISYSDKDEQLSIQTLRNVFKFKFMKSRGIVLISPSGEKENIGNVISTLLNKEGINLNFEDLFRNSYLLLNNEFDSYTSIELQSDVIDKQGLYYKMAHDNSTLGTVRNSINEILQLDRALSRTLTRDVLDYKAGTVITEEMIANMKRNKVTCIYVKERPAVEGKKLSEQRSVVFIPKGTRNVKLIKEHFPQYKSYGYLPEDIYTGDDPAKAIMLWDKDPLTVKELDFLEALGEESIDVVVGKDKILGTPIIKTFYFETEIQTNHTARYADLGTEPPEDKSPFDWVDLDTGAECSDKLTVWDLVGLTSLMASMVTQKVNPFLNRDTSFLQQVLNINEIFSQRFRTVADSFVLKYKNQISALLVGRGGSTPPFKGFNSSWLKLMSDKNHLVDHAETVNAIAEISHIGRIKNHSASKNSSDDIRHIQIPHYGRICAFETSAGSQIGLIKTKAIGAKMRGTTLTVPYRKIRHLGSGKALLTNDIVYLDTKQEVNYNITDIMKIELDSEGFIKDNNVLAIIPNPDKFGRESIIGHIPATQLDYVTVSMEQHLSPTANLIPFLGSDEAVRASYGLNMIRQSVYITQSQRPNVGTTFYKRMFDLPNSFTVKALKSGVIISIESNLLTVQYDGDDEFTEMDIKEARITGESSVFLNYKFNEGERFQKGDVLVDSAASRGGYYTPARNEAVAYIPTGWNHEDGVEITKEASYNYISVGTAVAERSFKDTGKFRDVVSSDNQYSFVPKHSKITDIEMVDSDDTEKRRRKNVIESGEHSGIYYGTERILDQDEIIYKSYLLSFKWMADGDKTAGRHGNKGVVTHTRKTSEAPTLMNGRHINIMLNPLGVNSRMNIGQILELHASLIAVILGVYIETDSYNGATVDEVKMLMEYCWELAHTENIETSRSIFDSVASKFPLVPDGLKDKSWENIDRIIDWKGAFNKNGTAKVWDPVTETFYRKQVPIGYPYYLKLHQIADEKVHARAGFTEEPYSVINRQPPTGKKNAGGQKESEWEFISFLGYGTMNLLEEIMNEKSDNEVARVNSHLKQLGSEVQIPEEFSVSRATEMLSYMLEVQGVKMDTSDFDELPEFDKNYVNNKYLYNYQQVMSLVQKKDNVELEEKNIIASLLGDYYGN